MYVIGTAGHVDHGKSALVQALTGIDPDRLQEEKDRGLTIDLGFAHFTLPGGGEVSIVDVPGHERFVKNMLAGAGGIDLVLLVIAADEGVKPQTREHLAILDLLDLRNGLIVLTKSDRADTERLAHCRTEATELLTGTSLEGAPVVACSAVTRTGLAELVALLESRLTEVQPRPDTGRPRLPVDRAFTMAGFGTVVTGTLLGGTLKVGQAVELQPGGIRGRIRGLQHHGRSTVMALPGSRTAVNLTAVAVEDLRRGMVLSEPGAVRPAGTANVRLRTVIDSERPLRHNLVVEFHTGAAQVGARVLLLEGSELGSGDEAFAQVRFAEPVAVATGDRFVIRDPNGTLGGGRVLEVDPPRRGRLRHATIEALRDLSSEGVDDRLLAVIAHLEPAELGRAAMEAGIGTGEAVEAAKRLAEDGRAVVIGGKTLSTNLLCTASRFAKLLAEAKDILAAYHVLYPMKRGMPREELRTRLGVANEFDALAEQMRDTEITRERDGLIALRDHDPRLTPEQHAAADAFLASLHANPFAPPLDDRPPGDILRYLEDQGAVVRAGDVTFARAAYDEMAGKVVARLKSDGSLTLAQVRDMFGTSRRYAQALLEDLDSRRVTRRIGDARVLR